MRIAIALALATTLAPSLSFAHEVGLSQGTYRQDGRAFVVELSLATKELLRAVELDRNDDGVLGADELEAGRAALELVIIKPLKLDGGAGPCPGALTRAALLQEDGVTVNARFECAAIGALATFDVGFLSALPHGHRHIAQSFAGGSAVETVLFSANARLMLSADQVQASPSIWAMVIIGLEHIVFGWDHLVFLLGLILVGGTLRAMLVVVTAFTVAHSITLGVMSLGVWSPPGAIVEALIAASIVYVGVENFFVKTVEGRWRITLPFGLIHGFGFAGALAEIGLPKDRILPMLLSFNIGVELGQVAILLLVLPFMMKLWTQAWFMKHAVKALNGMIIAAGLFWLVERLT